jgi:hypothetical protein
VGRSHLAWQYQLQACVQRGRDARLTGQAGVFQDEDTLGSARVGA